MNPPHLPILNLPHLLILNVIILTNSQNLFRANILIRAVKESAHLIVASLVAMYPYVSFHISVVLIASDLMYC